MSSADAPEKTSDADADADADADREWCEFCGRGPELLPLLSDLSLGVNETSVANALGLRNRRELRDWLAQRGLPPLRIFRNWYYLVTMVERFGGEETLSAWALSNGISPGIYSRFVRELVGKNWKAVLKGRAIDVKRHALELFRLHVEWSM